MAIKRLLAYSAVYVLWGGSYVAIRTVVSVIPPLWAAGIRYTVAGLILLAISGWIRRDSRPSLVQLRNAVFTGIMSLGIAFGAVFWAEARLPSWIVGILLATSFLWTYLGECLVERKAPHPKMLLAILAGLAAIPLIVKPSSTLPAGAMLSIGVVLGSACLWSASILVMQSVSLPRSYVQRAAFQLTSAGLALILAASLAGQRPAQLQMHQLISGKPLLAMAYLIGAASLLTFSAFQWLIIHEPPHMVATSAYINPLVALLAGVLLLHERGTPAQMLGATILLVSIGAVWHLNQGPGERRTNLRSRYSDDLAKASCDRALPMMGKSETTAAL